MPPNSEASNCIVAGKSFTSGFHNLSHRFQMLEWTFCWILQQPECFARVSSNQTDWLCWRCVHSQISTKDKVRAVLYLFTEAYFHLHFFSSSLDILKQCASKYCSFYLFWTMMLNAATHKLQVTHSHCCCVIYILHNITWQYSVRKQRQIYQSLLQHSVFCSVPILSDNHHRAGPGCCCKATYYLLAAAPLLWLWLYHISGGSSLLDTLFCLIGQRSIQPHKL